jgi:hypothetical protein
LSILIVIWWLVKLKFLTTTEYWNLNTCYAKFFVILLIMNKKFQDSIDQEDMEVVLKKVSDDNYDSHFQVPKPNNDPPNPKVIFIRLVKLWICFSRHTDTIKVKAQQSHILLY